MGPLAAPKDQYGQRAGIGNQVTGGLYQSLSNRVAGQAAFSFRKIRPLIVKGQKYPVGEFPQHAVGHPGDRVLFLYGTGNTLPPGSQNHGTGHISANPQDDFRPDLLNQFRRFFKGPGEAGPSTVSSPLLPCLLSPPHSAP